MDPESQSWQWWAVAAVWWGGAFLAVLGFFKVIVFAVGEIKPGLYERFRAGWVRNIFTGRGNQLIFGLGGFFTLALGLLFMLAAKGMTLLFDYVSRLP